MASLESIRQKSRVQGLKVKILGWMKPRKIKDSQKTYKHDELSEVALKSFKSQVGKHI